MNYDNLYVNQIFTWSKDDKKGTVVLKAFTKTQICVEYNDKLVIKPISAIGKTLFPQKSPLKYKLPQENPPKYTCKDCKLPIQGNCGGIEMKICDQFAPLFKISKDESDNWPAFGDATFYRYGGRR